MRDEYRKVVGRLDAMAAEVAAFTASARSADRCVRATVGPHGQLIGLTIDSRVAARLDMYTLAERILEATRLAAADMRERTRACVSATLPDSLAHLADPDGLVRPDGTVEVGRVLPAYPLDLTRSPDGR